ncbi:MAG: hypothetical protein SF187_05895 [Deltaproteobacteria bacterium]|nr:hypothetical protein [Deltaproteobacteria bacterium]
MAVEIRTNAFVQAKPLGEYHDVTAAEAAAASHDAAVVIWWREGSLVALTRKPDSTLVLVRPIASSHPVRTADLEAGALVARTAIVGRLNNAPLGTTHKPTPPPPPPTRASTSAALSRTPWELAPRLGWLATWDGLPTEPNHALEARIEGRWRALTLGLLSSRRPSVRVTAQGAEADIDSWAMGFVLAYDVALGRAWRVGAEGRFGWSRTSVQPLSGPLRDELRFGQWFVGTGLRLRRQVVPGRLGLWMAAGLDGVEDPFSLGLRDATGYRPLWYMWSVQPSVRIGLELTFSR